MKLYQKGIGPVKLKMSFIMKGILGLADILLSRYESRPTGYLPVLKRLGGSGKMPNLHILKYQHALAERA